MRCSINRRSKLDVKPRISTTASAYKNQRYSTFLAGEKSARKPPFVSRQIIGVLEGTGIGPAVIASTLQVLKSVEQALNLKFEVRFGGLIGEDAIKECGQWLPEHAMEFCADIFRLGGAILSGPGGG